MAGHLEMKELNFDEMSGEQLEEWAARIAGVKRDRRRAERQRERLLPRLQARLDRLFSKRVALSKDMAIIEKQIEGLKEGRPVGILRAGGRKPLTEKQLEQKRAGLVKARAAKRKPVGVPA